MVNQVTAVGSNLLSSMLASGQAGDPTSADPARNNTESPAAIVDIRGEKSDESSAVYSREDILGNGSGNSGFGLTTEDEEMIDELEARDKEVRQHERTHAAMLGRYLHRGPSYTYQIGPDGKSYAVGGSVEADVSEESDPAANAQKAQVLSAAATGAGDASASDMAMAAKAAAMSGPA